MEGRHPIRSVPLAEFEQDLHAIAAMGDTPPRELNMYADFKYEGHAAAAIDLNSCVGCNVGTVACQSENNILVVKAEVARGREMHWIRVDRYFGAGRQPAVHHQPVPCMHCEQAPCETVCPVAATVHSDEGLNDMVYNRCVAHATARTTAPTRCAASTSSSTRTGRRPASAAARPDGAQPRRHGEVHVLRAAHPAGQDRRAQPGPAVKDGEIQPACAQACPAQAIVFGDVNDAQRGVEGEGLARNYGVLEDLNTRPRTTYLGSVKNPNPEIA